MVIGGRGGGFVVAGLEQEGPLDTGKVLSGGCRDVY